MGATGSGGVSVVGLAVMVRVTTVSTVLVPVGSLIVAAEVNVVVTVTVFVEFALVLKVIWTGQSWNVDVVLSQYKSRLNRR